MDEVAMHEYEVIDLTTYEGAPLFDRLDGDTMMRLLRYVAQHRRPPTVARPRESCAPGKRVQPVHRISSPTIMSLLHTCRHFHSLLQPHVARLDGPQCRPRIPTLRYDLGERKVYDAEFRVIELVKVETDAERLL